MPLATIEVETAAEPRTSIIILHGLGADGNDFVPVAEELDLSAIGAVRFIFPHSPTRPVTINGGYVMPAWYDILGPGQPEDEAGLRASQALVETLIAKEAARGVAASRIVLAGFSQGCAMALMTGLRLRERLAGLACLSGYLPLAALTATERNAAHSDLPIFMAHGRSDGMIPIARAMASRGALVQFGHPVEWHDYPMQHSVCPQEIVDLNRWLLKVLV
ncbi:MAG: carboxylesterase [Burkholderiaceae bacterium]